MLKTNGAFTLAAPTPTTTQNTATLELQLLPTCLLHIASRMCRIIKSDQLNGSLYFPRAFVVQSPPRICNINKSSSDDEYFIAVASTENSMNKENSLKNVI